MAERAILWNRKWTWIVAGLWLTMGGPAALGEEQAGQAPSDDGFVELFNGKDLSGWTYGSVPVAKRPPTEVLDGKTATSDQVFAAKEGVIAVTGSKVRALYTAAEHNRDFELRFEFRALSDKPKDNSGVYIRGPQLQLDATNEGGLTGVFRNVKNFRVGDWNEIDITVTGTAAVCRCNGELVGKTLTIPETGTIGLQSEYGPFEFRRIRIKEAP